ncbi:hypothetical protein [Tardisphaera saccharovorans]
MIKRMLGSSLIWRLTGFTKSGSRAGRYCVLALEVTLHFIIPVSLTLLLLSYLLKPGYAGFMDNGGFALPISSYIALSRGPWGFFFGTSMIPQELIYSVFPNKIGAWKASIFFYQYASYLSAYASTRVLRKNFPLMKSFWLESAFYFISLAYSFNTYIVGGFLNYFSYQFEMPQVIAPLLGAYVLSLIFNAERSVRELVKKLAVIAALGAFVSSSPPMVVAMGLLMLSAFIVELLSCRGVRHAVKVTLVFVASAAVSFFYFLIYYALSAINYFGASQSLIPTSKDYFWGPGVFSALTDSYGAIDISRSSYILAHSLSIPSSVPAYVPFSMVFWLGAFYMLSKGNATSRKLALALCATDLVLVLFLNGFHADNVLSSLLYFLARYLPNSLLFSFQDSLPDLASVFPILFLGVLTLFLTLGERESGHNPTKKELKVALAVAIVISIPIMINYGYIQLYAYSAIINPTPIPSYYRQAFNFMAEHANSTYAWFPVYGTPAWRGCFLSNIPGYLGGLYGIKFNYLPWYVSAEIVQSLYQGQVPLAFISKYHVQYVVVDDSVMGYPYLNGALSFMSNSAYFRLAAHYGDIYIYEFINSSEG